MAPNRPIFASCPTGGPHYFVGGETCVCGGMGAVVTLTRAEYKRLTAQLAAVTAERDALRISLRWAEQNTTHDLSGHGSNMLRMCRVCDQVGERDQINHAPDCPFAALAARGGEA
jgi:hypothetical protein